MRESLVEESLVTVQDIRNVAIIAHVDHGKTTLVDQLLRQSGMFREGELRGDCILDSNDLERERGITILAKNIALQYGSTKINLIDTPGHADFGGEVERVLRMADGCLLLVDAFEGPMPQTRFVLRKAFEYHLRPIVVVNKMDRHDARPSTVIDEVFDLFVELGADDEALDFPIVYASAREGWASSDIDHPGQDVRILFESIINHVPPPKDDVQGTFQMLVTTLDHNSYQGRIGIGRVFGGAVAKGDPIALVKHDGQQTNTKIAQLYLFDGLGRIEVERVEAGDICAVVGLANVDIGDTLTDPEDPKPLLAMTVDQPTLHMTFRVNDSPVAGRSGSYVTSRHLRDRLDRELESNVALRVDPGQTPEEFHVSGRGILHLSILIESMRREGYEFAVGKPEVIYKRIDGQLCEPLECMIVDVPARHIGAVMELAGARRAECMKTETRGDGTHLEFIIPARGLIGLRNRLLTATNGEAILHHNFYEYGPKRGEIAVRTNGVMIATDPGMVTGYALANLQERGALFVVPGQQVYVGQIVGEFSRENDVNVNVCKEKKLTNMRASGSDKSIILHPAREMTLEMLLEYVSEDELVEITPAEIRLRKRMLNETDRKRSRRPN